LPPVGTVHLAQEFRLQQPENPSNSIVNLSLWGSLPCGVEPGKTRTRQNSRNQDPTMCLLMTQSTTNQSSGHLWLKINVQVN